jgi:hypothetical protein
VNVHKERLSGPSDSADFGVDGQDHAGWCFEDFFAFPIGGRADKERSSVRATQNASDRDQPIESVFGGGLASGENPENSSPDWISHPNSTFGVEADPIGWGERRSIG